MGLVMGVFSISVGIKDSNEAELIAVAKALELSSLRGDLSNKKIIVESDSSSVVSWMRKPSSRPWYFHELFILAARFSLTLGAVFSSHVLCEANHFADGLAKQASHGCDLKYPGTVSYGTFYVSCLLLYSFSFLF
jgi:ribonuclease HI